MAEKAFNGTIGQMYEERKTGKRAVLVGQNDEMKLLTMNNEARGDFQISYSSFRSAWRKYVETPSTESEVAESEVTEPEVDESTKEVVPEVVNYEINNDMTVARDDENGEYTIVVAGFTVLEAKRDADKGTFYLRMLPDVFSFSDWTSVYFKPMKIELGVKDHLTTTMIVQADSFDTILSIVDEAVRSINLYGYIEEEPTPENDKNESEEK